MRITLSKSGDPRGRHVVIVCKSQEEYNTYASLIRDEICPGRRIPVERVRDTGEIRLRFNISYLERIMLSVPFAEISTGVEKMLFAAELERLIAMPIPVLDIPGMKGELWEHQAVATEFLMNEKGELLNDEMGAGKTKAILAAILAKSWYPALIVVGSVSAKYVWRNELERWFPDVTYSIVDGNFNQRKRALAAEAQVYILNVQALRIKREHNKETGKIETVYVANPDLYTKDWEVFVCDEYHRLKNPSAQQTQGFLEMECGRFIGASGTPIMGKPEDAWSFLHKCEPEMFPTFYHFETQIGKYTKAGKLIGYQPDEMLKLRNWLNRHSLRRRKEHIAAILRHHGHDVTMPEVIHSSQVVPLTPEQRKIYDKIKKEMVLLMDDGSSKNIPMIFTQILRLKQAAFSPELFGGSRESGKIAQIKEDVAELVASGEKAIIFAEYATATRILQRELAEYNPAYVDGSVKGEHRDAEQKRFNEDPECKLFIGTIGANQEAITLSAATYVLFADRKWSPLANEQAEARSAAGGMRGLGVTVPVNIISYEGEDTIEQRLSTSNTRKRKLFQAMIEKDGGKQIRPQIINSIRGLL